MTKDDFETVLGFYLDQYGIPRTFVSVQEMPGTVHVAIRATVPKVTLAALREQLKTELPVPIEIEVTADRVEELPNQMQLLFAKTAASVFFMSPDGSATVDLGIPSGPEAHTIEIHAPSGAIFLVMTWRPGGEDVLSKGISRTLVSVRGDMIPCVIRCDNRRRQPGRGDEWTKTLCETALEMKAAMQTRYMEKGWELRMVNFRSTEVFTTKHIEDAVKVLEEQNSEPPWDAR